jgi:multicomponent K+:H+ antiporter subunit D
MLRALADAGDAASLGLRAAGWTLFAMLIGSGLLLSIALARVGIRHFWAPQDRPAPRLRLIECVPVAALLAMCLLLVVRAEPVLVYTRASAQALHQPTQYIDAVMSARPRPAPKHAKEHVP